MTCSDSCRSKRSRRLKRQRKKAGQARAHPDELQGLYQADTGKIEDVAMEVMRAEVQPVVREALTDDVLRAIQDLVHLTPLVVQKIREDIEQTSDPTLRQRAYTLVAKYTLGHPSVAPAPLEQSAQGMNVTFVMPRPGDTSPAGVEAPADGEAVELKKCMECSQEKPATEFVAASNKCIECYESLQRDVTERFGE